MLLLADVGKRGLCFEAKERLKSISRGQVRDISAFKDEIVSLVSMNGGKLSLDHFAFSDEKAFRKHFCLIKYGYPKLHSLIQEMGNLFLEGDGPKKFVYMKNADDLDVSIDISKTDKKRKRENS